jgi:cardiolipin synthase C
MPRPAANAPNAPATAWRSVGALIRLALLALLTLTTGCATLPPPQPRPIERALQDTADTPLARLAEAALPADPPGRSGFRLFFSGESSFNARVALARRATRSLDLQYYLLANDDTGRGLLRELRDAAQRGVRVRLLLDDLHAPDDALLAGLAVCPNVQVRLFNPLPARGGSLTWRLLRSMHDIRRINHRMHNKLFIADNAFAISGGRNVGDEYFMHNPQANFLDLDLLSAGPVVRTQSTVFDSYWNSGHAVPVEHLAPTRPAHEGCRGFDAAVQQAITRLGERQRDQFGRTSFLRQLERGAVTLDPGSARVRPTAPTRWTITLARPARRRWPRRRWTCWPAPAKKRC